MRRPLVNVIIGCQHGAEILERLNHMATQEQVDAIAAAIDTATTGIAADIADLKAAVEAGNALDFSALDAKVAALAALDAENPEVPPVV